MTLRALWGGLLLAAVASVATSGAQDAPASRRAASEIGPTWLDGTIGESARIRLFFETAGFP